MRMFSVSFFVLSVFFVVFSLFSFRSVEVVSVYCKKEIINGKTFVHREDFVNSVRKEVWSVGGKLVGQNEYEESILDEEKELRRCERKAAEECRKRSQAFKDEMVLVLNKKILRLTVEKIEDILKKFDNHNIGQFLALAYKEDTVSQDVFGNLKQELLPEAKRLIYEKQEDVNCFDISGMVSKIENLDEKLELLFEDTVRKGIETCHDTKVLKELLELVS